MPSQAGAQSQPRDSLELASDASSSEGHEGDVSEATSRPSVSSSRWLSLVGEDPLDEENPAGRAATHPRSYSVSSAFDFAGNLFPLSSTTEGGGYAPIGASASAARPAGGLGGVSLEKHKTLTFLNGLSLVIGIIIGAGSSRRPVR